MRLLEGLEMKYLVGQLQGAGQTEGGRLRAERSAGDAADETVAVVGRDARPRQHLGRLLAGDDDAQLRLVGQRVDPAVEGASQQSPTVLFKYYHSIRICRSVQISVKDASHS